MATAPFIAVINGPNLNLLGKRNQEIYGSDTLDQILTSIKDVIEQSGYHLQAFQSNSEGEIIDAIQKASGETEGLIINAGAYSHTSIAIRDALECYPETIIEVHLSNIFQREHFRRYSYVSEVAAGVICGFGGQGYLLAVEALLRMKG